MRPNLIWIWPVFFLALAAGSTATNASGAPEEPKTGTVEFVPADDEARLPGQFRLAQVVQL